MQGRKGSVPLTHAAPEPVADPPAWRVGPAGDVAPIDHARRSPQAPSQPAGPGEAHLLRRTLLRGALLAGLGGVSLGGVAGWFRCPYHGLTYTKGGIRVFGPATRSMDTFQITAVPAGPFAA